MKGRIAILLAVTALLCCSCGGRFKDIKVTSCEVKSLVPTGFSKMEALLEIGIDNPATELHLTDLEGVAKLDGEPCVTLTTPDIVIEGHSAKTYTVTVTGRIDRSFDLLRIISITRDPAAVDAITLDFSGRGALSSGLGKNIEKKDIPLKDLIGKL